MRCLIAVLAVLGVVCVCHGRTITVDDDGPADFATIQAGIDDSNDGDTVLVADGIYTGDGNRDIDFHGKAITVKSENGPEDCIIDCNGTEEEPHRGFYFHSGENQKSVLEGVTIISGYADEGGGIYYYRCSPTLANCMFVNNRAKHYGGGLINTYKSSPTLTNCKFYGNSVEEWGGGIYNEGSIILTNCAFKGNQAAIGGGMCNTGDAIVSTLRTLSNDSPDFFSDNMGNSVLTNCTFSGNSAEGYGGGMCTGGICFPMLTNCTFNDNSAEYGGAFCWIESNAKLTNCILWENSANYGAEIAMVSFDWGSSLSIRYSDVQGGPAAVVVLREGDKSRLLDWGPGNIDADPCFVDAINDDYHLKSQGGRWDANEGRPTGPLRVWTTDEVTSPCIDAGDPMTPIGLEPFPSGGIVNMGAYGGTAEASKSYFSAPPCEMIVAGDINGDCKIDFSDFRILALNWMWEE